MTTRIGELRSRLRIERPTRTANGSGGFTTTWATLATVWAKHENGPGAVTETPADGQRPSRRAAAFTIRRRTDVTNAMRVVLDSVVYEIREVVPDPVTRQWTTLQCLESPEAT